MYDMHSHTAFSDDCDFSLEEQIQGALQHGLEGLAITDHYDPGYPDPEFPFILDFDAYHPAVSAAKEKYAGKLDIIHGMELGIMGSQIEEAKRAAAAYPFDYIIASFHCYRGEDLYKLDFGETSREDLFRDFFVYMHECLSEFTNYDILGHFTIIDRYIGGIFPLDPVMDVIREDLKLIIDNGSGIEINTSHHKYNMPVMMPRIEVLKAYKELGGEILTIGSDAHDPSRHGEYFDEAIQVAKDIGFRYYTVFHDRKPEFLPLP